MVAKKKKKKLKRWMENEMERIAFVVSVSISFQVHTEESSRHWPFQAIFSGAIVCSFPISSIVNDSPDMFYTFWDAWISNLSRIDRTNQAQTEITSHNVSFAKQFNWFSTECNRCPRPPLTLRHRHRRCLFSTLVETLWLMNHSLMHIPLVVVVIVVFFRVCLWPIAYHLRRSVFFLSLQISIFQLIIESNGGSHYAMTRPQTHIKR